jgi:DNA gyrase subunit A
MSQNRPDLNNIDPEVVSYIEYLENELDRLRRATSSTVLRSSSPMTKEEELEISDSLLELEESPTTSNVIVATAGGLAKRTPRHHYTRQRRSGMGIFDLDAPDDDPPALLTVADHSQTLLLLTNRARAFRVPVGSIPETPIRARGESIVAKLDLDSSEKLAVILPEQAQGHLVLLSQRGVVRSLRHHVFGEYMKPGTSLYDLLKFGPLVSACWTPGDSDLFIATLNGQAIRFAEKLVNPQGIQAIRLTPGDRVVGITYVYPDSGVFLLSEDGKGAIRLMAGFNPNKAPGGGGKVAIKTNQLVCALNTDDQRDIFIITQLSKIIRFRVDEVPPKEGVVQGVICISLRNDRPTAVALNPLPNPV